MILGLGVLLALLAFGAYLVPLLLVYLIVAIPLCALGIATGVLGYRLWRRVRGR